MIAHGRFQIHQTGILIGRQIITVGRHAQISKKHRQTEVIGHLFLGGQAMTDRLGLLLTQTQKLRHQRMRAAMIGLCRENLLQFGTRVSQTPLHEKCARQSEMNFDVILDRHGFFETRLGSFRVA